MSDPIRPTLLRLARKVGRNELCPCGNGKKYKRCCGQPAASDTITRMAQDAQRKAQVLEFQRRRQQGLARPIVSKPYQGQRLVVVGEQSTVGPWRFFTDFLQDHIKHTLGSTWGNGELAKPEAERHPLLRWYREMAERQQEHFKAGELSTIPAYGVLRAYLWVAYDLYTIEHNIDSKPKLHAWERLLRRLRDPAEFFGARNELRIAAIFVRAGFKLEWEDETDNTTTHGEFTAAYPATGREFWVECKMRQPEPGKNPKQTVGKFTSLVVQALRKKTDRERIVFVDLNMPVDGPPDNDAPGWRDWAVSTLRKVEADPNLNDLPPALVMITNYPDHHHLDTEVPDAGCVPEGFKMDDYRLGDVVPIQEAIERRERNLEIEALLRSMREHIHIPTTFDGEIPELIGVEYRLLIGQRYELEHGKAGTLEDAALMEERSKAAVSFRLDDGTNVLGDYPLSNHEVTAWKRYPETFLGQLRPPNGKVHDAMELYEFFLYSASQQSEEALIKNLGDEEGLDSLSQPELAKRIALRTTINAGQVIGGFRTPTWAQRLRKPPNKLGK